MPTSPQAVPLTMLRQGDWGALLMTDLFSADRALLDALGLAEQSRFRLCKVGDPWIVQVRSTRIGLSEAVARRLLVVPEAVAA